MTDGRAGVRAVPRSRRPPAPTAPTDGGTQDGGTQDGGTQAGGTPSVLRLIGAVGSPLALFSALLFYFGWVRSDRQARAFGADVSVFEMSGQDYVLRSVNVLFVPGILVLLLSVLAVRADGRLRGDPPLPHLALAGRALQWSWAAFLVLVPVLAVAGAGTASGVLLPAALALAVLGPCYGTLLRRHATADRTRFRRSTVVLVGALVTVLSFWQTERLARLGGDALADEIKADLAGRLSPVVVYSGKDLHLEGPGVHRTALGTEPDAGYRYSGLFLLQRSGGKYFLLTEGWTAGRGVLVVLPDTSDLRLQFGHPPAG